MKTRMPNPAIISAVRSMLAAAGVAAEVANDAVSVLLGEAHVIREGERQIDAPLEDLEIVTRPELAKLLKCSVRNIDYHRRQGRLVPVYITGSKRLRGFTARSVRNLLGGGAGKEGGEA